MVILKLTKPVSSEFECEVVSDIRYNLIRPCERYKELYKSCKSLKNRLHQYYVYGELLDCSPHKQNYDNCMMYRKTNDLKLLDSVREWEENYIRTRLETVKQNKVWQMRDGKPPENFDSPLPDFIVKRQTDSLFRQHESNNGGQTSSQ